MIFDVSKDHPEDNISSAFLYNQSFSSLSDDIAKPLHRFTPARHGLFHLYNLKNFDDNIFIPPIPLNGPDQF